MANSSSPLGVVSVSDGFNRGGAPPGDAAILWNDSPQVRKSEEELVFSRGYARGWQEGVCVRLQRGCVFRALVVHTPQLSC